MIRWVTWQGHPAQHLTRTGARKHGLDRVFWNRSSKICRTFLRHLAEPTTQQMPPEQTRWLRWVVPALIVFLAQHFYQCMITCIRKLIIRPLTILLLVIFLVEGAIRTAVSL